MKQGIIYEKWKLVAKQLAFLPFNEQSKKTLEWEHCFDRMKENSYQVAIEWFQSYKNPEYLIYLEGSKFKRIERNQYEIQIQECKNLFTTWRFNFCKWILSFCNSTLINSIFSFFPIDIWGEIFDYLEYCPLVSKQWIQIFYSEKRPLLLPKYFSRKRFFHLVLQIASHEPNDLFLNKCINLFFSCPHFRWTVGSDLKTDIYERLVLLPFQPHTIEFEFYPAQIVSFVNKHSMKNDHPEYSKEVSCFIHHVNRIMFSDVYCMELNADFYQKPSFYEKIQKLFLQLGLTMLIEERQYSQVEIVKLGTNGIFIKSIRFQDDTSEPFNPTSVKKLRSIFPKLKTIHFILGHQFYYNDHLMINLENEKAYSTIWFYQQICNWEKLLNVNIRIRSHF